MENIRRGWVGLVESLKTYLEQKVSGDGNASPMDDTFPLHSFSPDLSGGLRRKPPDTL